MKWIKACIPYFVIILAVVLLRTFIVTPVQVDGSSMFPTLKDHDIILLKKYDKKYKYGDIVILNYLDSKLVKRIIGVPGDLIEVIDGTLYINQKKINDPYSHLN